MDVLFLKTEIHFGVFWHNIQMILQDYGSPIFHTCSGPVFMMIMTLSSAVVVRSSLSTGFFMNGVTCSSLLEMYGIAFNPLKEVFRDLRV